MNDSTSTTHPPAYSVNKIDDTIDVTGCGADHRWAAAEVLSDFSYPWETDKPHPTTFKALHNTDWLFCLFEVMDPSVHIYRKSDHKLEVAASSRAEMFFKIDDELNPYYCLELDPSGRIFDYRAHHYRKFDTDWSWPERHLIVKTNQTDKGYTVEVAISKDSLRKLKLLKGNTLHAGLYRADCFPNNPDEPDFKWISWVRPASETPDFHIPSSFGIFQLVH